MKGTLYLGRIREFKILKERDVRCFAITRSDKFHDYMEVLIGLAPSWELLKWHNSNKDRENFNDGYYDRYYKQVKESKAAQEDIKEIMSLLDSGQDVALICFCTDYDRCHRGILGTWLEKKGYTVIRR